MDDVNERLKQKHALRSSTPITFFVTVSLLVVVKTKTDTEDKEGKLNLGTRSSNKITRETSCLNANPNEFDVENFQNGTRKNRSIH